MGDHHNLDTSLIMTHVHLVPGSRMHGAIPPLPSTHSWCGA